MTEKRNSLIPQSPYQKMFVGENAPRKSPEEDPRGVDSQGENSDSDGCKSSNKRMFRSILKEWIDSRSKLSVPSSAHTSKLIDERLNFKKKDDCVRHGDNDETQSISRKNGLEPSDAKKLRVGDVKGRYLTQLGIMVAIASCGGMYDRMENCVLVVEERKDYHNIVANSGEMGEEPPERKISIRISSESDCISWESNSLKSICYFLIDLNLTCIIILDGESDCCYYLIAVNLSFLNFKYRLKTLSNFPVRPLLKKEVSSCIRLLLSTNAPREFMNILLRNRLSSSTTKNCESASGKAECASPTSIDDPFQTESAEAPEGDSKCVSDPWLEGAPFEISF